MVFVGRGDVLLSTDKKKKKKIFTGNGLDKIYRWIFQFLTFQIQHDRDESIQYENIMIV